MSFNVKSTLNQQVVLGEQFQTLVIYAYGSATMFLFGENFDNCCINCDKLIASSEEVFNKYLDN